MKPMMLALSWLFSGAVMALPHLDYLTEDAYPYNYPQANGEPGGLAVSLLHLTWQALGQRPTPIRLVPWPRGYYLLTQKPDVVLFSTTRTPQPGSPVPVGLPHCHPAGGAGGAAGGWWPVGEPG